MVVCEDMSKALSNSSKQQDINEEIPNCQYFYVIIGKEAGIKTVEEFKVALESRNTIGKPKIYTYFYNLDEQNQTESVAVALLERGCGATYFRTAKATRL